MRRNTRILVAGLVVGLLIVVGLVFNVYGAFNDVVMYKDNVVEVRYEPRLVWAESRVELRLLGSDGWPMAVKLYGVWRDGFREIASGYGRGSVSIDITGYMVKAYEYTEDLGWSPRRAGPSLLAIVLVAEMNFRKGLVNLMTQMLTIPVVPKWFKGVVIKVNAKYRPIKVASIKLGPNDELLTKPLREGAICVDRVSGYECYYWRLNETLYSPSQGVPITMIRLNERDGLKVREVVDTVSIMLFRKYNSHLASNMGVLIVTPDKSVKLITPGPGFTVYAEKNPDKNMLLELRCHIHNQLLTDLSSACMYFGSPQGYIQGFNGDAVLLMGFLGAISLSKYQLVSDECSSGGCTVKELNTTAYTVWLAPLATPRKERMQPWIFVDDSIDGSGYDGLVDAFTGPADPIRYIKIQGYGFSVKGSDIVYHSRSSPILGLAIPIGALAVSHWNIEGDEADLISSLVAGLTVLDTKGYHYELAGINSEALILSINNDTSFRVKYYRIDGYYVQGADDEYPAVAMLIEPTTS